MKTHEKVMLFATIFLSLLALFVSMRQTSIMSDMRAASVWPYVQVGNAIRTTTLTIEIGNDGVGPAKIKDLRFEYRDSSFYWIQDLARHLLNTKDIDMQVKYSNLEGGKQVLKAGENRVVLELNSTEEDINKLRDEMNQIAVFLKYCSIYDQCWINEDGEISKD